MMCEYVMCAINNTQISSVSTRGQRLRELTKIKTETKKLKSRKNPKICEGTPASCSFKLLA